MTRPGFSALPSTVAQTKGAIAAEIAVLNKARDDAQKEVP